jgi:hypothetical protein
LVSPAMTGASPPPNPGVPLSASGQGAGSENLPGNIFPSPKLDGTSSFGKF